MSTSSTSASSEELTLSISKQSYTSFNASRHSFKDAKDKGSSYAPGKSIFANSPVPNQLTSHERLLLARQNLGFTQSIVHVVKYPAHKAPSRQYLEMRVSELQVRLPRLSAYIANPKGNRPYYSPGAPWDAREVVRCGQFTRGSYPDEITRILREEQDSFDSQNFDDAPMWRVLLLTAPECNYSYLVVCFHHMITDGRGSLRLLHLLTDDTAYLPVESFDLPTRLDDTVTIKPSIRYLAPVAFRELVVPKLPKVVQARIRTKDPWPKERVGAQPMDAPANISVAVLSASTLAKLKTCGKLRGVKTLHPIIQVAYTAALWRVFGNNSGLYLNTLTTRDERNTKLGHSEVTGCYYTNPEWHNKISGKDRFWSVARRCYEFLHSERGVNEGRYVSGLLYHIPDPEVDVRHPDYNPAVPTGFEAWLVERALSPAPFRNSVGVSNLGASTLPNNALDHFWTQTPSPCAPAYHVNIIGHEGGLRVTAVFRDGSAATKTQTDALMAIFTRLLERLAAAQGGSERTVAELTN